MEWITDLSYVQGQVYFPNLVNNTITHSSFRNHLRYDGSIGHLDFGFELAQRRFGYDWIAPNTSIIEDMGLPIHPLANIEELDQVQNKSVLFFELKRRITEKLSFVAGGRTIRVEKGFVSAPAVRLQYAPAPQWMIQIVYYESVQFQAQARQANEFQLPSLVLPLRKTMLSHNYSLDNQWSFSKGIKFKFETYYRGIHSIPTMDAFLRPSEYLQSNVVGLDISFVKNEGYITWQLGASIMRVFIEDEGNSYPADWDIPVSLKGVVGLEIGKKWYFNVAARYRKGYPYTPGVAKYMGLDYQWRIIDDETNSARYPDYFRADISLRKVLRARKGYSYTISFQILNIGFSQNMVRYYDNKYVEGGPAYQSQALKGLPILPSIGVEYVF